MNEDSTITIRPATEADRATIRAMINREGLNPFGLDWRNFLVADDGGHIVSIGQVKPHADGSRELASIATVRDRQKQGLSTRVIRALLSRESGTLYLMCEARMVPFYERFGFRRLRLPEMPPYFRQFARLYTLIFPLTLLFKRGGARLAVMRRDP